MSNNELLNEMINKFGIKKATEFSQMISYMYSVLHENNETNTFNENGYECDWWKDAYNNLKSKEACIIY